MPAADTTIHSIQTLYADHHGWLQGWLRRRLGNAADAADLAHDTFLRLIASRDALIGLQEPRAYLTTTAKRLLIDRSRHRVIEQAYLAELALLADTLPHYPSPAEIMAALEALNQIAQALDRVLPRVREAFLRHYLEQQTQAEIALVLGVSKRMVQKYLAQALVCCHAHCPALAEHGL